MNWFHADVAVRLAQEPHCDMLSVIETLVRKPTVDRYLASRFTLLRDTPASERSRVRLAEWETLFQAGAWSELIAAALPHYDAC